MTANAESPILTMTKQQLIQEAQKRFGLTFTDDMPKHQMIEDFLDAQDAESKRSKTARAKRNPKTGKRPRVRVIFHNQGGPGGSDDIFVSVNGRAYLIKREHEVMLPFEVMRVIENAEQSVFERGADNRLREKLVKRYSYTMLGDAA
jgi:hypothetical protein